MTEVSTLQALRARAAAAAGGRPVRILAVAKTRTAQAIRQVAADGQIAFGENYVQEALAKQPELADLPLQWHLIGPLQSNKSREVALHFDWLESLDRDKLVPMLARHRPPARGPLNILVQVNIDDESSKSGCAPEHAASLCAAVAGHASLALRGLMAIPAPHADLALRRQAFRRMRELFEALRVRFPGMDTLSMGMSEDFELAIAEGATEVRIGSLLFGARAQGSGPWAQ